jgi:hypothetical protein
LIPHVDRILRHRRLAMTQRTALALSIALIATAALPFAAAADDTTYPPGTECANLPTISARLLCGRQELKRGDAAVQQQKNVPAPPYDGWSPDPDQAQPAPGTQIEPAPELPSSGQQTAPQP